MNPFTPATIAPLAQQFGTPLWIYDAATITPVSYTHLTLPTSDLV